MKQLWTAVCLLAAVILLLAWNGMHLIGMIQPLQQDLDQAMLAVKAGEWEQAEELTREVSDQWKDSLPYLYLLQSHRDVDEINILLEESLEYMEGQSTNAYAAMNARIQGLMENLCRIETFSISNLL